MTKCHAAMKTTNQQELVEKLNSHRMWIETSGAKGEKLCVVEIDFRHIDISIYRDILWIKLI